METLKTEIIKTLANGVKLVKFSGNGFVAVRFVNGEQVRPWATQFNGRIDFDMTDTETLRLIKRIVIARQRGVALDKVFVGADAYSVLVPNHELLVRGDEVIYNRLRGLSKDDVKAEVQRIASEMRSAALL